MTVGGWYKTSKRLLALVGESDMYVGVVDEVMVRSSVSNLRALIKLKMSSESRADGTADIRISQPLVWSLDRS